MIKFAEKRNKVNFLEFQKQFAAFPAISIQEIEKSDTRFNLRNLTNWQNKGYIQKVRNGWYILTDRRINEELLFTIANQIYTPSYVSLESALSWHGLIPEGVFTTTSVCSRKTQFFETPLGKFTYQNIQPSQLSGFRLIESNGWRFKMADAEKALVDFFHLHPQYNTIESVESLRLNPTSVSELSWEKIDTYTTLFENKALIHRLKILKNAFSY